MRRLPQSAPARLAALLLTALLVPGRSSATSEASPPSLKAAFLLNFAKFAEWPRDGDGPLTLCVVHDRAVESALAQLVNGTTINGRALTVARGVTADHLRGCHLLYVPAPDAAAMTGALAELRAFPVLTVGDGEAFPRHEGIVGLLVEGNKMRFAINPEAAHRAGVRLSARLLSLATIVGD